MHERPSRWQRLHYWIREFLGENDYARYLEEWRRLHGGTAEGHRPLTAREFFGERLRVKYGGSVQRCC